MDHHLAVQQRGHLLAEVLDNGIRSPLNLQTLGDRVQPDTRIDRAGDILDLLGLLGRPHRGTELCGRQLHSDSDTRKTYQHVRHVFLDLGLDFFNP